MEKPGESDVWGQKNQIDYDLFKMQNEGVQVLKIDRRGRLRNIKLRLINGGRSISWSSKVLGPKLGSRNRGIYNDDYNILNFFYSLFLSFS